MPDNPLVSIIIPCYNSEEYVSDAINSVLGQTYQNIEVIVINDGSTDSSEKVIQQFGTKINYISVPNGGACKARNLGISRAKGALIKFLDADDMLLANCIEKQVEKAIALNLGAIVYGDSFHCDEKIENCNRKVAKVFTESFSMEERISSFFGLGLVNSSPLYIKEEILKINGFNERLTNAQEIDLNVRLILNGSVFTKCEDCIAVKVRTHNSPFKIGVMKMKDPLAVYNSLSTILDVIIKNNVNINTGIAKGFAFTFWNAGRNMVRKGYRKEVNVYFRKAKELHPDIEKEQVNSYYRLLVSILGPSYAEILLFKLRPLLKTKPNISN